MQQSWIRLTLTYLIPQEDGQDLSAYFFEQDVYAVLYASATATINEQDCDTLDGADLAEGQKRLLCYFDPTQGIIATEMRTMIAQMARTAGIALETSLETFDGETWKDGWKAWFKPSQVSPRLAIRAPWSAFDPPSAVRTIVIEPGMAFGTGLHETTRLCIEAIDDLTSKQTIETMLDVGCGSGVLAIAAGMCGVKTVRGVDNDPICIDVSRENAALNQIDATFDETDIWDVTERYDLVVANIISSVLKALKEDIKSVLKPSAILVLSGILDAEKEDVEAAFIEGIGVDKIDAKTKGEWCSMTFVKR